jgi:2-oxoglutarate dehydrogenase E1 component
VNGDDPEACVFVATIAEEYRHTFHKDVVIDLVCFRRLGHNEQDEPFVTQPLMYKKIAQHPGTRKLYADKLEKEGVVNQGFGDELVTSVRAALDAGKPTNPKILYGLKSALQIDWAPYIGIDWRHPAETAVTPAKLKELAKRLTDVPANFKLHPSVERLLAGRREMAEGRQSLDWGMAENLAYAACVDEGHPVRLSGQDAGRGTFAHRHAVLHDQNREKWDAGVYIPLQNIRQGQANFLVIDSLLSEEAVLGFEYGYATAQPYELVIWEAQFGDFANGAQVVIDQFIASGESKWGRMCGLTMFLPHGYEGAGPRALLRAPRALPAALRRAQHPGVRAVHRGPVLPHDPPPGEPPDEEAAHRDDAQEPAAQEGSGDADRRAHQRRLPGRHPGSREALREEGEARGVLRGQGVLRHRRRARQALHG